MFGDVFSIAHSVKGEGFDEIARRNGGTAVYRVTSSDPASLNFHVTARYDGQPVAEGESRLDRDGMAECFNGACHKSTDASGLLYNQLIWGRPPARLVAGQAWTVEIGTPWELGPPAKQQVRVLAVDRAARTATLLRQGSGEGRFANERSKLKITRAGKTYEVDVVPGAAHWRGWTTFRNGFIQADELVMEREVRLVSPELGELKASERILMLLNAMPADN